MTKRLHEIMVFQCERVNNCSDFGSAALFASIANILTMFSESYLNLLLFRFSLWYKPCGIVVCVSLMTLYWLTVPMHCCYSWRDEGRISQAAAHCHKDCLLMNNTGVLCHNVVKTHSIGDTQMQDVGLCVNVHSLLSSFRRYFFFSFVHNYKLAKSEWPMLWHWHLDYCYRRPDWSSDPSVGSCYREILIVNWDCQNVLDTQD